MAEPSDSLPPGLHLEGTQVPRQAAPALRPAARCRLSTRQGRQSQAPFRPLLRPDPPVPPQPGPSLLPRPASRQPARAGPPQGRLLADLPGFLIRGRRDPRAVAARGDHRRAMGRGPPPLVVWFRSSVHSADRRRCQPAVVKTWPRWPGRLPPRPQRRGALRLAVPHHVQEGQPPGPRPAWRITSTGATRPGRPGSTSEAARCSRTAAVMDRWPRRVRPVERHLPRRAAAMSAASATTATLDAVIEEPAGVKEAAPDAAACSATSSTCRGPRTRRTRADHPVQVILVKAEPPAAGGRGRPAAQRLASCGSPPTRWTCRRDYCRYLQAYVVDRALLLLPARPGLPPPLSTRPAAAIRSRRIVRSSPAYRSISWTGGRPTLRTFGIVCLYLQGWACWTSWSHMWKLKVKSRSRGGSSIDGSRRGR